MFMGLMFVFKRRGGVMSFRSTYLEKRARAYTQTQSLQGAHRQLVVT
jgi:hypothetical protein